MIRHLKKYLPWLLLLTQISCSTSTNRNTDNKGNEVNTQPNTEPIFEPGNKREKISPAIEGELFNHISDVGDINQDGRQDSVVFAFYQIDEEYYTQFQLFFGCDKGYELKYRCPSPGFSDESSISIKEGGILEINNSYSVYTFRYHDNELYLEEFEEKDESLPYYKIDFVNNKLIFELYIENDFQKKTINIPAGKYPVSSKRKYPFEENFINQYISYDEEFFNSYIESANEESKEEIKDRNTPTTTTIDNDTLFQISSTMGESANLSLTFRKRDLSPQAIDAIIADLCMMVDTFISCHETNLESIYNFCLDDWKYYNQVDEEGRYVNSTFDGESNKFILIEPYFEEGDLISYLFEHSDDNYRDGYFLFVITYNKKTGESFTWDMVKNKGEFGKLVRQHLSCKEVEQFKLSLCPPFIQNDSLCLTYQYYEITPARVWGRPSSNIPLEEVKPFLTEEGVKFLREGRKKEI